MTRVDPGPTGPAGPRGGVGPRPELGPGPIRTPLIPATFDEEEVSESGGQVPMDRPGEPAEVATAHGSLASEDGPSFAGQVLHPNGVVVNG